MTSPTEENLCDRLGEVAASLPLPPAPEPGQWAALERRLSFRPPVPRRWQVALPIAVGFALVVTIGWMQRLHYQTRALEAQAGGTLATHPDRVGRIDVEDGSWFELGPASSAQVASNAFRRGVDLKLLDGQTKVSVVHRFAGRWNVHAGPFHVRVTGTQFTVEWKPGNARFRVQVSEGSVRVSGSPLNGETPVSAGQSLDVDTHTKRVTWSRTEEASPAPPSTHRARFVPAPAAPPPSAQPLDLSPQPQTVRKQQRLAMRKEIPGTVQRSDLGPVPLPQYLPSGLSALDGPAETTQANSDPKAMNPSGALFVKLGSRARFQGLAIAPQTHLFEDEGRRCTHARLAALSCPGNSQIAGATDCDWEKNWGMVLGWSPRVDHKPWGAGHANAISFDFQGTPGPYRLVAHVRGNRVSRDYCVLGYTSGQTVTPGDFRDDCSGSGGPPLANFASVEFFALHRSAGHAPQTVQICLSAVNLE